MLSPPELMLQLYLANDGPYCAEACAWLHEDEDKADTLDLIEYALDAFCAGELEAETTVANIARVVGYSLTAGDVE